MGFPTTQDQPGYRPATDKPDDFTVANVEDPAVARVSPATEASALSGDSGAAKLDGSNMPFTGEVDIDTPAGLWVYDSANSGPFSNVAPDGSITSNRATPGSVFRGTVAGDGADRVNFDTDGMAVGDGTTPPDTSFRRHAAGVWDIPEVGGGIRFTSPNGLVSKVLSIDNSGNPVWT